MIRKTRVQSCCGSEAFVYELDHPIDHTHLNAFLLLGWTSPPHYKKAGVFFVENKGVMATAPFGSKRINAKISGLHGFF
jgi:hypothetical protein